MSASGQIIEVVKAIRSDFESEDYGHAESGTNGLLQTQGIWMPPVAAEREWGSGEQSAFIEILNHMLEAAQAQNQQDGIDQCGEALLMLGER